MPVALVLNLTSFASPSFSEEPRNPYGDSDCIFSDSRDLIAAGGRSWCYSRGVEGRQEN